MKKNLQSGLDAILNGSSSNETESNEQNQSKQKATTETVCFRCDCDLIGKIRYIAATERLPLKDVMEAALENAVARYEAKNGKINKPTTGSKSDLFK